MVYRGSPIPRPVAAEEQVFIELTVIIFLAVASHFVIKRFRQPTIIGEIGIGIVLGPSVAVPLLHRVGLLPATQATLFTPEFIQVFASLGAIFLLFLIGLETDLKAVFDRRNVLVASGGVIVPWAFGFLVAYLMVPDANLAVAPPPALPVPRFVMAMFVGATLVATSTAIAAAVLLELGMIRTTVATTIMGAVIVDDVLGLLVLSISQGMATGGGLDIVGLGILVVIAVAFIVLMIYIGTRYFGRFVSWAEGRGRKSGLTHTGFMAAMAVAFFSAFLAEVIGLSAVVGAFLAGAMFSNNALKHDFHEGVTFLGSIFTPIFFISLGLLVNVWVTTDLAVFGGVLLVVAFLTKLGGCGLAAWATGMSRPQSLAIGYGMVPRGEVGLIIALAAEQSGVIGPELFSIIVLVMVIVSVVPAPFMRKYLLEMKEETAPRRAPEQSPF